MGVNFRGRTARDDHPVTPEMLGSRDEGEPGEWRTTDALPGSGHDEPIDDCQRNDQREEPTVGTLRGIANRWRRLGGDPRVARRLAALAEDIDPMLAQEGGGLGMGGMGMDDPYAHSYSTADLQFPGEHEGNDGAIDESEEGGTLQFYGTKPVQPGAAGPKPRGGVGDVADAVGMEKPIVAGRRRASDDEDDEDFEHEEFEHEDDEDGPECGGCGGPLMKLGMLGNTTHYRCRDCGMDWNSTPPKTPKEGTAKQGDREAARLPQGNGKVAAVVGPKRPAVVVAAGKKPPKEEPKKPKKDDKKPPKKKTRQASADTSPWETIKRRIRVAGRRSKIVGGGSYDLGVDDHGRAVDLSYDARLADGAPLSSNTLTFEMVGEDRRARTARIAVLDPRVNRRRVLEVREQDAAAFARDMAGDLSRTAEQLLG